MKILLNVSTATKGGALHLSTAMMQQALLHGDGTQWCMAVSDAAKREIEKLLPQHTGPLQVFEESPARSRSSRRALARLEAEFQPDCVFTPYGPAYVPFSAPHLLGVAVPWIVQPSLIAYKTLDFPHEWIKFYLYAKYREFWFRRADAWWVETECAKQGLARRLGVPSDRIQVVPNTCGSQYRERETARSFPGPTREVRLLYFTAPYKHKNLDMIPRVAKSLCDCREDLDFRMVTTLPEDHIVFQRMMRLARSLGVAERIDNRGPIPVADGPKLYEECDICFMPSLMEVFSATYPEAMAMGLPIVTSDLDFARHICGDAALYFEANNPSAAAQSVRRLLAKKSLWDTLVQEGKRVLLQLPTPREKYRMYRELLNDLVEGRPLSVPSAR